MHNCSDAVRMSGVANRDSFQRQHLRSLSQKTAVRSAFRHGVILLTIMVAFGNASSLAQDSSKPPDQSQQQAPAKPTDQSKQGQTNSSVATQAALKPVQIFSLLEKKSIVFPDIASNTVALSPTQKFEQAVDNAASVHTMAWAAIGSAFGQSADSPTGFNQGWNGYGKRVGSSMARQTSAQFFGTFVIASALHEDPRFFPEYNPTLKHAIKYSFKRLFITRSDAGQDVVNKQGLLGPLLAEGLANVYWPDRNRTAGDTLFRYGVDLAVRAGGNMFREYWPVVFAKVRHVTPAQGASY
jgi:hypothetical protein